MNEKSEILLSLYEVAEMILLVLLRQKLEKFALAVWKTENSQLFSCIRTEMIGITDGFYQFFNKSPDGRFQPLVVENAHI